MSIVQLRVNGFFGGEEKKKNRHGTEVYYPIVTFEIPEEPPERVAELIRNNKKDEPCIMATVTTTDRALTQALFGILAQEGEEFDFYIDPPREGKVPGWMKSYPRPGTYGFDWPDHLPDPKQVRDEASGEDATEYQAEETVGVASTPASSEGLGKEDHTLDAPVVGPSPSSPDPTSPASDNDWGYAMDEFGASTRAPIIKAVRARRLRDGGQVPVEVSSITTGELDAVVEDLLSAKAGQ